MAIESQIEKLMSRLDIDEETAKNMLDDAADAILSKRYPFGERPGELPVQFHGLQLRLATVYFNKIGAEGESAHSEAGVSRSYESEETLLRGVTPLGAVL